MDEPRRPWHASLTAGRSVSGEAERTGVGRTARQVPARLPGALAERLADCPGQMSGKGSALCVLPRDEERRSERARGDTRGSARPPALRAKITARFGVVLIVGMGIRE